MEKQLKAKMRPRRPQISRRTFCVRCFTARFRVPDGVSPLLDTSRARWPRAQPFVHVHTFTECYTRNGSHDAWHACVARMTWRVCGSILISWWSGGYWATSQNSPYCCVSAHAPSPRFRPFVHPFRASSTPPLVTPARGRGGTPRFFDFRSMKNLEKKEQDAERVNEQLWRKYEEINSRYKDRAPSAFDDETKHRAWNTKRKSC